MARRGSGYHNHYRDSHFGRGGVTVGDSLMKEQIQKAVDELRAKGEHIIKAATKALKEGADKIVEDAKKRVPVKTGKLRDSIKAESVDVGGDQYKGALYEILADAVNEKNGVLYGQFVEFSPKINKPFLYPAMDAQRNEVINGVKNAIAQATARGN